MTDKKEKILFSKDKILKMERFKNRVDLLSVLLEDGKWYEFKEVDKLIQEFEKATERHPDSCKGTVK